MISFLCVGIITHAATNDVYLIMTNPSSDCSHEMNIVWHANIKGTFVEYTKKEDTSFSNKMTSFPIETELEIYDGTSGGIVKDYKCEVTLKELEPNTDYIYRIGLTDKSSIHSFKTAGANNFNFAVVSDIHTYSKIATRLGKANTIVSNMNNLCSLNMVIAVGDLMAYGTNRGYWDDFTKSDLAQNYMIAATPGNHDYYNSSANFLDGSYFNAYTNNPDNGSSSSFNTTYYFYYGDVLFISLNSEDACTNSTARANQREWLDSVFKENEKAIYKIVYFHRSMYPGSGSNTGHASTMKSAFQDLFDKYGVDLVFGGHDHVYVRTNKIINGTDSPDSNYGTTYISLPQIGDRASTAGSDMTNVAKKIGSFSGGVLVQVTESSMFITLYDENGNELDSSKVSNKMSAISKGKINNNTKISFNDKFSNMFLTIPDILFQRAYNVKVIDKQNNQEVLNIRPIYEKTDYKINGISDYIGEKDFQVVISYRDGSSFTKDIVVKNNIDYGSIDNIRVEGATLKWDATLNKDIVSNIKIIEENKELELGLDASSFEISLLPYQLSNIKLQLIAIDNSIIDEIIIPYGVDPSEIVFATPSLEVYENNEISFEIVNSLGINIPFTYQFDSEYIDERNGILYAKKEGETTIICKNESFNDLIVNVKILKTITDSNNIVEPKTSSGCTKSSVVNVMITLFTVFGVMYILKKKQ